MKLPDNLHGKRGIQLLQDPFLNKGTAFTEAERDAFGLRGLLPPRPSAPDTQLDRVMGNLNSKDSDLEKFIFLSTLHDRNEVLFYRTVCANLEELVPIIYTPTIGKACQNYSHIFRRPRGLYISIEDKNRISEVLQNWPHDDVRMIVVTDGERILGLGDLGANGMGIPIGKLSLYTACAGIAPEQCLPITLDVGTNNQALREDPLYLGLAQERLRGPAYEEFIEEFINAARARFPRVCIQFEDFGNANAFHLLHKYRDKICTFNDDIQGTASVALAGIYSALRITGKKLTEQRFLFLGAGEAGLGIGELIVEALKAEGLSEAEARRCCWFFDSKGLVVQSRTDLVEHKKAFAHDHPSIPTFLDAIQQLRPTGILGVAGMAGGFDQKIVEAMAQINERPLVFALSNPTSKAECTAEQAYTWSEGRAVVATGSPFPPVQLGGKTLVPGQGNNAYIFPGVGLGVVASDATRVTDEMFFIAAQTLAGLVKEEDLAVGRVYPHLNSIREVSLAIGIAVAENVFARGLTEMPRPADLATHVKSCMFEPDYAAYA